MTTKGKPAPSVQVALDANRVAYQRAAQSSVPRDCWDFLVLTAANEKQAQGYRQELSLRHKAVGASYAFFPPVQRSLVVADPVGPRVGSGGATLGVMRALAEKFQIRRADWDHLKILLIHSGGMSQRLPAYSPLGKIFAPLPLLRPDGQIATLFDHLYVTLAGLPERLGPGMLVLAGDVFLLFDHRQVSKPAAGVTALTMRVDAELGRGHGVYVIDRRGAIRHTLQKVSVETMREHGTVDEQGQVLIDTGLLFFDPQRTQLLAAMAGVKDSAKTSKSAVRITRGIDQRQAGQLDLYEDMTAALANGTMRTDFLREAATRQMRAELWKQLNGIPFSAMKLDGQFLHLGTTRQFRDAMIGRNASPAAALFQHNLLLHSDWPLEGGQRVYQSALLADGNLAGALGEESVVEQSVLRAPSRIRAGSVVSQVLAEARPIELGDKLLLFQVPVHNRKGQLLFVQIACGIEDDFKGRFSEGRCVYLNENIESWMKRNGVLPGELWKKIPVEKRTLWTAQLFAATPHRDAAGAAPAVIRAGKASRAAITKWRQSPRFSMEMALAQSDPAAMNEHRELILAYIQASEMLGSILRRETRPVEAVIGHYTTAAAYEAALRLLSESAATAPSDAAQAIDQARTLWCAAEMLRRPDHPARTAKTGDDEKYMRSAFAKVAAGSEMGHSAIVVGNTHAIRWHPGLEIIATAPVRLDLTGGWSDTPPYCFECGGHVVNLAMDLDGRPPVRVILRTIDEPKMVLESADLGQQIELKLADLRAPADVHDPFSLHKVALAITGVAAENGIAGGMGLHVKTECAVPKGSGLGTSSILAAALLAALHELRGKQASTEQIIEQTLLLEQRLGAGGGWQDQIGGIVGGVKSTISAAGIPQKPIVERLDLSDRQYDQLEERMVVYFSGQQRLARDILRRVMGRWLGREPAVVGLLNRLKESAGNLRRALLKGNWAGTAREIERYWQIKRELYPGSTTPKFDVLMAELEGSYLAGGLAGAGGGGFGYFLCRNAGQARRLREALTERSGRLGSSGMVYDMRINRDGLRIVRNRA